MADIDVIEKTILRVAGYPVSGPFKSLAREMAEEIAALDAPKKSKRVVDERETR